MNTPDRFDQDQREASSYMLQFGKCGWMPQSGVRFRPRVASWKIVLALLAVAFLLTSACLLLLPLLATPEPEVIHVPQPVKVHVEPTPEEPEWAKQYTRRMEELRRAHPEWYVRKESCPAT